MDAIFKSPFYLYGPNIQQYLRFIILSCKKDLHMTCWKIIRVNIPTSFKVILGNRPSELFDCSFANNIIADCERSLFLLYGVEESQSLSHRGIIIEIILNFKCFPSRVTNNNQARLPTNRYQYTQLHDSLTDGGGGPDLHRTIILM